MNKIITNPCSPIQSMNAFERMTKKSVWPAYAGCIWALFYAVFVRFYEAAGGIIGNSHMFIDLEKFHKASYFAGVIILVCGFILLGLVKPWGKVVPAWMPLFGGRKIHRLLVLIPTLLCTAFLIAHGVTGILTKILYLTGFIELNFPRLIVFDMQKLALWDLFFYEPWFLIMGILAGLTAAHYAQSSGVPIPAFRRGLMVFFVLVFLLTSLSVSSIIFDFVDKISF